MAPKLGILAGSGDLPRRIIAACVADLRPYFVIAFEGQTDPETVANSPHAWIRLGAAGKTVRKLHDESVEHVVMAGGIRRPSMAALRPDWWAARFLARTGALGLGDDGLLSAIVRELEEKEGFRFVGVNELIPEVLAEAGTWGRLHPDHQAAQDIERGREVALAIGALDVGQGVVVQQGLILAVEAIEGTDAMLDRCAELKREGLGGVLVKIRKPGQEDRADLPTIGPATVSRAAAAGLRGIAVEAGATVVLDFDAMIRIADESGLFLIGIDVGDAHR